MKCEDVAKKLDVEEERIGVIGKAATYTPSSENSYLCSMRVDTVATADRHIQESSDEYKFVLMASLFKKFLESHFSPSHLVEEDVRFWLMAEVPKGFFRKEIKIAVEEKGGMYFTISEDEATGLSQFIPVVKYSEEESDG